MDEIGKALSVYAQDVADIAGSPGSTEATFYPAVHRLLAAVLKARNLPFNVRVNTSQRRGAGGTDLPDLALYDGAGDFVAVFGEVKPPSVEIADLAVSTDRNDQIGRYLAQTRVVLLTNIRTFGLVSAEPSFSGDGPVPAENRRLLEAVDLWPSAAALSGRRAVDLESASALADLVETAVTEFASIAEPESLAQILARQARRAKAELPETFSSALQPLLDDFAEALGLTFEGAEGEEFLRSSLIQTAFYGLFAGWTLWHHAGKPRDFDWRDLGDYLKIPFLGALFYEFRHPVRLKELGLAPHLERATATLYRVDEERFFRRFALPLLASGNGPDPAATGAILYFYEPFLEAFDPDLRKELGVWYTPQEIVRYQVRKVEGLLRDELDCPRGFADDRVVVLDPCCGTGAYLIEVLRCVAEQLQDEGAGAAMPAKLLDAFCRRILGFEILTAPFVVADAPHEGRQHDHRVRVLRGHRHRQLHHPAGDRPQGRPARPHRGRRRHARRRRRARPDRLQRQEPGGRHPPGGGRRPGGAEAAGAAERSVAAGGCQTVLRPQGTRPRQGAGAGGRGLRRRHRGVPAAGGGGGGGAGHQGGEGRGAAEGSRLTR